MQSNRRKLFIFDSDNLKSTGYSEDNPRKPSATPNLQVNLDTGYHDEKCVVAWSPRGGVRIQISEFRNCGYLVAVTAINLWSSLDRIQGGEA